MQTSGYFDDDGNELNPDVYPKPQLCLSCKKQHDSNEEIMCSLTRLDQMGEDEFRCCAYQMVGRE